MLNKSQEKLIRSLKTKKARQEHGLCLVEGKKVIDLAKDFVDYAFTNEDSEIFEKLVTTETPQSLAAVARVPKWKLEDISSRKVVIFLDGVQDPGNVGSVLRLCLGFDASLVLIESADVTSPKVVRSSVGAMFQVPWIQILRKDVGSFLKNFSHPIYRLENKKGSINIEESNIKKPLILVAGSEGEGIKEDIKGKSVYIKHSKNLESLNVSHSLAIALFYLNIE